MTPSESALLESIARLHLGIRTLETRNSDGLDFHVVPVWKLRAALQDAYESGRAIGRPVAGTTDARSS